MPVPHRDHPETRCALSVRLALWSSAALLAAPGPLLAQATPQQVEVVGTSPLPGQGVDRNALPYGTQVVRRAALDEAQADNASDYLARRVPGVQVNDIQGSPFQSDLTYRGYRASGLIGASQGLSVFLDGVRINEPFGDVVNWDLVPEFAVQSMSLVPGANPAFGLNTLGGALVFNTASGLTAPGGRAELTLGSFGRKRLDLGYGRQGEDGWHQYLGASLFDETGWRDHSDGHLGQALLKIGRSDEHWSWTTQLLLGRSRLVGNGLSPMLTIDDDGTRSPDIYPARRSVIYTYPDHTDQDLAHWQANLLWNPDDRSELSSLVYLRSTRRDTLNGDTTDEVEGDINAAINTSQTRQTAMGLALAWSQRDGDHRWQSGLTLDASRVRFRQDEQAARFTADRGVEAADEDPAFNAAVRGHSWNLGVFVTDTWQLRPGTHLTGTLRGNLARVTNTLSTGEDDGSIEQHPTESFRYSSMNPALGVVQQFGGGASVFANLARNTRVPTVIELGCADPAQPCRLPAGMQSDPYLKQVVATSLEAGWRWRGGEGASASVVLFHTDNRDDIVFGSLSTTSQLGYFRNIARTRHQGLDLAWEQRFGALSVQASASYLDATYQVHDTLRMGDRNVEITPGTRMAGLPRTGLKLGLDWRVMPALSVGADLQAWGRRGTIGNEDGRFSDETDTRADLSLPGYALVNLRASWTAVPGLEVFGRIGNLLNRRVENFGAIGTTVFDASGQYTGEDRTALFVAPGAPRQFQVGARWRF